MKRGNKHTLPRGSQGCGTDAAYQRHIGAGEKPCPPCSEAHAAVQRQPEALQARRDYDKARVYTNTRMRDLYPEQWQEIFDEERKKIIFDRQWAEAVSEYLSAVKRWGEM